jgi:hypothetical protein
MEEIYQYHIKLGDKNAMLHSARYRSHFGVESGDQFCHWTEHNGMVSSSTTTAVAS